MKIKNLFLAGVLVLTACGSSKISNDDILNRSEPVDGVAILETMDNDIYFVDENNVPVCPQSFRKLGEFNEEGYAVATSVENGNSLQNIVNRKGEILTANISNMSDFHFIPGGRVWVSDGSGASLKDLTTGTDLYNCGYVLTSVSPKGTAVFENECSRHPEGDDYARLVEFQVVDRDGNIVVPFGEIGYIGDISGGMAPASNQVQGGYKGDSGKLSRFSRDRAVGFVPRYGYIDEAGKWVIPEQYTSAGKFDKNGFAVVSTTVSRGAFNDNTIYIDRSGRKLSDQEVEALR
ncbi:MAG: WG repeat-containing protein [Muribaculaceae bacterium]|nr:WG repeat-containing protein [Muribaculaceae bacterium]